MNQKELKELIEFLIEKDIAEFELERGDVKVRIKRAMDSASPAQEARFFAVPSAPPAVNIPAAAPQASAVLPAAAKTEPAAEEGLHEVRSPIVGTFYESPSPGAPPFVK